MWTGHESMTHSWVKEVVCCEFFVILVCWFFCSSDETHSYVISTVYLQQSLGVHAFKLLFSLWFSWMCLNSQWEGSALGTGLWSPSAPRNSIRTKGVNRQSFFRQMYCRMSSLSVCTLTLKAITFSISITGTGNVILSLAAVVTSDDPVVA